MYRARKFVPLFQVILRYYTCYINDHPSNGLSNLVNQVENCFVSSVCNLESIDLLDKIDLNLVIPTLKLFGLIHVLLVNKLVEKVLVPRYTTPLRVT